MGVVSVAVLCGCSTSYAPRPGPRVAVAMQGGSLTYLREGKAYHGGAFGGDIDDAVRGNALAEAHANAYRAKMIGGFAATMGGIASAVAGAVIYGNSENGSGQRDTAAQTAGITLGLGGIAAYVTGLVLMATAQPDLWDAINLYNDSVYDPGIPPRPYGPYAPPPGGPHAPAGLPPYGGSAQPPAQPYAPSPGVAPPGANAPVAPSQGDPNAPAPPSSNPIFR
jgi:hypothetical protein